MKQEWQAHLVLRKWTKANFISQNSDDKMSLFPMIDFYNEGDKISIAELELVVMKAARIVERFGPNYLDIFERAERELANAKSKLNKWEKVCIMAKSEYLSHRESYFIKPRSFLLQAWTKAVSWS